MPSYFRAKAEAKGFSPPEFTPGSRLPRFIMSSAATVYPDDTLVFDFPNQVVFDLASTGANILTTVQRIKFLKDIKNGVMKEGKNEKIIQLGKEKSRGLLKFGIYNSLVLGLIGVYSVVNSIKH